MRMKRVVMGAVVGVAAMGTCGLWPGRRLVMEGGGVNGGRTMRVHLVDETTGLAVAGARVTANEPGEWRTGADGAAVIGRPAGEPVVWTVYVEAAGYLRQEVEWFDDHRIAGLPKAGEENRVVCGRVPMGRRLR